MTDVTSAESLEDVERQVKADLATQCIEHHADMAGYTPLLALGNAVVRGLGLEPSTRSGRLAFGVHTFLVTLAPAVILTLIAAQWSDAPWLLWAAIALFNGAGFAIALTAYRRAAVNHLAWVRTVVREEDLLRLLSWERRWYSNRMTGGISVVAAILVTALVFSLLAHSGPALPLGSYYVAALLIYMLMTDAVSVLLVVLEARELSRFRHAVYRLSPADSVPIRRSLRGYNQLGIVNAVVWTPLVLGLLFLLPSESSIAIPAVVILLLVEVVVTTLGALAPRVFIGQMVRSRKEEEEQGLQRSLDALLPRVAELSDEDYSRMKRLHEMQDTIRNSPENLLPLGAVLRTIGPLLASIVTILATVLAQEWVAAVMKGLGG